MKRKAYVSPKIRPIELQSSHIFAASDDYIGNEAFSSKLDWEEEEDNTPNRFGYWDWQQESPFTGNEYFS